MPSADQRGRRARLAGGRVRMRRDALRASEICKRRFVSRVTVREHSETMDRDAHMALWPSGSCGGLAGHPG